MPAIKSFFVLAFIFFQGVLSYCIYNNLQYPGEIDIRQDNEELHYYSHFKKIMNSGTKECCPYSNKDCAPRRISYDNATFYVSFHWRSEDYNTGYYTMHCFTGGAIIFNGTKEDHRAYCKNAEGVYHSVYMFPDNNDPNYRNIYQPNKIQ